ncbi:hypothetical protein BJX68DRAFT_161366 [Aspergillus pseudodeflectus]|uniref:Uncharacterized protein n=1 Tax=Aspergillus pseudodeflectus TaxID=176178 RepID=A0ABR4L0V2_9EURO
MVEAISRIDASGPPAFSIIPPFIPAVIKRRLTSRYAIVYPRAMSTSVGNNLPPSSSPGNKAQYSEQSSGYASATYEEEFQETKDSIGLRTTDYEVNSGLRWNCVNSALSRLRLAGYEAQRSHCERSLVRSLYLDAVSYLLSGLPEDLTDEEASKIRNSVPEKVKPLTMPPHPRGFPPPARSYLHRLLASSIIYFCLLLQFLMPFIKEVIYHFYQHERSLRLIERATSLTLYILEQVSRGGVNLGATVLNMYDGKISDTASSATSWWVEGVAGGIYEGLEEGIMILGFTTPNSKLERPSGVEPNSGRS